MKARVYPIVKQIWLLLPFINRLYCYGSHREHNSLPFGWIARLHLLQCDQIGRFIALWATFQILWQQLLCPNLLHS